MNANALLTEGSFRSGGENKDEAKSLRRGGLQETIKAKSLVLNANTRCSKRPPE